MNTEQRIATYLSEEAKQELAFLRAKDDFVNMIANWSIKGHRDRTFKVKTWMSELGWVVVLDYPDCRGFESRYHFSFEDAFIDAVGKLKESINKQYNSDNRENTEQN